MPQDDVSDNSVSLGIWWRYYFEICSAIKNGPGADVQNQSQLLTSIDGNCARYPEKIWHLFL